MTKINKNNKKNKIIDVSVSSQQSEKLSQLINIFLI